MPYIPSRSQIAHIYSTGSAICDRGHYISVTCLKIVRLQLPIGENIMDTKLKSRKPGLLKMAITVPLSMPVIFWISSHGLTVNWTAFGKAVIASLQAKTIWDWMELLLMPLVLAGGVLLLTRSRRRMEHQRAVENAAVERDIATDHQKEEALQAYFDRMADLLLKEKLSKFSPEDVQAVARIRTLTVLRGPGSQAKRPHPHVPEGFRS